MADFASRLLEQMKKHNINGTELATKFNITKQAVSSWTRGKSKPDADTLAELSALFDVSTDYLLCLVDNPNARKIEVRVDTLRQVETLALSRTDNPDEDLPEEALKQIEDFKQYMRLKHKKPD